VVSEQPVVRSHRDLVVWQKSMDLVDTIYALARLLPSEENYGLRSQMTRASVSVPANIAEGSARTTSKDFANFLSIARSSAMELETLLTVALRQDFVPPAECEPAFALITEVSKMLSSLRSRVLERKRGT
jgi:four helix bundle protein